MLYRAIPMLLLTAAFAGAQNSQSAEDILNRAASQAATGNRAVWVLFHASW